MQDVPAGEMPAKKTARKPSRDIIKAAPAPPPDPEGEHKREMRRAKAEYLREEAIKDADQRRRVAWLTFLAIYVGVVAAIASCFVGIIAMFIRLGFTPANVELLRAATMVVLSGAVGFLFGKAKGETVGKN